jgi:hypothetical protein
MIGLFPYGHPGAVKLTEAYRMPNRVRKINKQFSFGKIRSLSFLKILLFPSLLYRISNMAARKAFSEASRYKSCMNLMKNRMKQRSLAIYPFHQPFLNI